MIGMCINRLICGGQSRPHVYRSFAADTKAVRSHCAMNAATMQLNNRHQALLEDVCGTGTPDTIPRAVDTQDQILGRLQFVLCIFWTTAILKNPGTNSCLDLARQHHIQQGPAPRLHFRFRPPRAVVALACASSSTRSHPQHRHDWTLDFECLQYLARAAPAVALARTGRPSSEDSLGNPVRDVGAIVPLPRGWQ